VLDRTKNRVALSQAGQPDQHRLRVWQSLATGIYALSAWLGDPPYHFNERLSVLR
jgi:hypothetical protein